MLYMHIIQLVCLSKEIAERELTQTRVILFVLKSLTVQCTRQLYFTRFRILAQSNTG